MFLVAIAVAAITGFTVYRLHYAADANTRDTNADVGAQAIAPFNPKNVLLEVFGEPGATARISYTDVNAQPQHVDGTTLPWAYADTTTAPAVVVNIMAQSDGSYLGCRIVIDGVVKVEKVVEATAAYTYCLDKSG
jgi:hypothetical protein